NRTSAMAELRSILSLRSPLYAEAEQMIDTNSVGVTEAARMIAAALLEEKNGQREAQARAKRERDSAKPQDAKRERDSAKPQEMRAASNKAAQRNPKIETTRVKKT